MKKIDFTKFPVYAGIKKEMVVETDLREEYGDWMYRNMPGIKAHCLAEKIYRSEGVLEINGEEEEVIRLSTRSHPGRLADSRNDYLDKMEDE